MTKIKITGINTKVNSDVEFFLKKEQAFRKELIEGTLTLDISDGEWINTNQELDINRISNDLKRELCSLLIKIENELNGTVQQSGVYRGTFPTTPGTFSGVLPSYVESTSENVVEEQSGEEEVDLFDAIYKVAKVAIKDYEKETVEKVANQLIKAYKEFHNK